MMRRHTKHKIAAGFTIIELMIASAIFGTILLVVAVGVSRFTNDYYRGVTRSKTQSTAQSIVAALSQTIEFGKTVVVIPPVNGLGGVCVDNTLYSYRIGQQVTDTAPSAAKHQGYHGLVASTVSGCSVSTTPSVPSTSALPASARELLGQHMRVGALNVSGGGGIYTVQIRVIYGDDDLLTPAVSGSTNWANEGCATTAGSQFCAASDLATSIGQRLQ